MTTSGGIAVALAGVMLVGRLAALLICRWTQVKIERARQASALDLLLAVPPGAMAVVQQPDGTVSTVVRLPGQALGRAGIGGAHDG